MKSIIYILITCFSISLNAQSKLFWSEYNPSSVKSIEMDGTEVTTILKDIVNKPSAITVDREGGYIYYANQGTRNINRCNLDGTDIVTLIRGTINAQVIRIDHVNNKIYYGDVNVARILRTDLDGSNEETIFQSNQGVGIYGLELDILNNKMYFSTYHDVYVSDLNAENVEIIVPDLVRGRNISLDLVNNKLYFLDESFSSPSTISRCNLDGSNIKIIDTDGIDEARNIAIDYENGIIYWADSDLKKIMSADINGGNVQTVLELETLFFTFNYSVTYDAEGKRLYWTDTSIPEIRWINTETNEIGEFLSDQINDPNEIIVDNINKKLYRTDGIYGLYRSDFDGLNPEKIIASGSSTCFSLTKNHIYYYSSSKKGLMRTSKDGSNETKIVSLASNSYVVDLEVDESNGLLFWIDAVIDKILKSNIDGTEKEEVTSTSTGWSLALNPSNQTVYFTSRTGGSSSENTITAIDYNGENREVLINAENGSMGWITIDTSTQKLFWTEGNGEGGVYTMNIDGTDKELIQTLDNEPRGIAYFNENITSIHNIENQQVTIYPIPSKDNVVVKSDDAMKSIMVYKMDGTLISKSDFANGIFNAQVDLASHQAGQYIITIDFFNGNKKSEIIQKLD